MKLNELSQLEIHNLHIETQDNYIHGYLDPSCSDSNAYVDDNFSGILDVFRILTNTSSALVRVDVFVGPEMLEARFEPNDLIEFIKKLPKKYRYNLNSVKVTRVEQSEMLMVSDMSDTTDIESETIPESNTIPEFTMPPKFEGIKHSGDYMQNLIAGISRPNNMIQFIYQYNKDILEINRKLDLILSQFEK
jgi:hypothetical protein